MHACISMRSPRFGAAVLYSAGLIGLLASCDAQASPFYRGQSLLTVRGSVSIAEDHTRGELKPALAFPNQQSGKIHVLDVAVKGEFPSDFRIDVYDPPDDDMLVQRSDLPNDEPRIALGAITAVTPDHPDTFRFATTTSATVQASTCPDCACDPVLGCRSIEEWCTHEGSSDCYRETTICPTNDSPLGACIVEREGDRSLKDPAWRHFAGFSQNYAIAYLESAAPDGSVTAAWLGAPKGLDAGYHLIRVLDEDQDLQDEYNACHAQATTRGIERYNEQHSTEYTERDLDLVSCGIGCLPGTDDCQLPGGEICALPESERENVAAELTRSIQRAALELECLLSPFTPVEDLDSESIAIRIGPDVQPRF